MVGRSNAISREICQVQDVDDEPSPTAAGDTASPMAQAPGGVSLAEGNERAIPGTSDEAAWQKSELS
jgi:hypothetical protein